MNAYQLKPKSKRNPVFQKGFEQGRQVGYQEATDIFHKFLSERMQTLTDIPGIGEKTAWKVHEHLLKGMDKQEG
ncbi:hypothetical protein ACFFF5_21125 [Lederbergia wuyishanensis]|uniref:Helix-hairpin-helix DNA-binding motif class 1 domain-containing protein n=1 Tax=Lederbergia wuyishanensis TaxID=1347903 RepID=A0ABU0D780_9BACI|nr:hypothetical protein [Lederbergia wuyishanensis]MCJ8008919.1 hypothetical protein [Lederbergia wuyishanensis]MDQ0344245.1 hypothetical protein [Lederbergia wuyishanensis]